MIACPGMEGLWLMFWSLILFVALVVGLVVVALFHPPPDPPPADPLEREDVKEMLRRPPKRRARSTSGISPWGTSGSGGGLPSQRGR